MLYKTLVTDNRCVYCTNTIHTEIDTLCYYTQKSIYEDKATMMSCSCERPINVLAIGNCEVDSMLLV